MITWQAEREHGPLACGRLGRQHTGDLQILQATSAAQAILPEALRPVLFGLATAFPSANLRALEVRKLLYRRRKEVRTANLAMFASSSCGCVVCRKLMRESPSSLAGGADDPVQQLCRAGGQRVARPPEPQRAGDCRAGTRLAVVVPLGGHGPGPLLSNSIKPFPTHLQCREGFKAPMLEHATS